MPTSLIRTFSRLRTTDLKEAEWIADLVRHELHAVKFLQARGREGGCTSQTRATARST